MALLTVLAIAAKPFIPQKVRVIYPAEGVSVGTFGPTIDGHPTTSWVDEKSAALRCEYPERYNNISCGAAVYWNPAATEGIAPTHFLDASQYDGFRFQIAYEGRAEYLRIFLNNYNPDHQKIKPGLSEKHLVAFVSTDDLRSGRAFLSLQDFIVEEWWVVGQNPPRHIAGAEFGHLTRMGIDNIDPGIHRLRIDQVELVGDRITNESYLLLILFFWVVYLLLESSVRYYKLKMATRHQREQLENLSGGADQLTKENVALQTRSVTDSLTGIHNRNGLLQQLQTRYGHHFLPAGTGLMVMDIDHFKAFNDRWGHHAGDAILCEFASLISSEVRAGDIFARWGGEEFILLIEGNSASALRALAEKLRQRVAAHKFPIQTESQVTISVGVARTDAVEPFDTLFKRADVALYEAKKSRNHVHCAFTE